MTRTGLALMVMCLTAGMVGADCAWVLWQIDSPNPLIREPRKPSPLRAFDRYQSCVEDARGVANFLGSGGKNTRLDLESQQNVTVYKDSGPAETYVFKCLPHPLQPE
jgi:hypothetical protein